MTMFEKILWPVVLLASLALAACGGGSSEDSGSGSSAGDTTASATPAESTYRSVHDPQAVYTLADVEMTGSYLKLDFSGLSDAQLNRVVHRLRTEISTCGSGQTIDECLVTRPQCWISVTLAEMVIREEKLTP